MIVNMGCLTEVFKISGPAPVGSIISIIIITINIINITYITQ